MATTFENKCAILADLWLNYKDNEELEDFVEYNDLGLPLAYGVRLGGVKKAGDWEVSLMKQDAEANALSALWTDSDFGGEAVLHDGMALRAAYGLADGWVVRGSYFDVEVNTNKVDYTRAMLDLVYTF